MANQMIRDFAKERGLKLWQVADACGIADSTFCRQLRHELPKDEQERIIERARAFAAEREGTYAADEDD